MKAMNGKTIEIQNTDAEGRLVLCDLLHYANVTHKPEFLLDLATLTGACVMALGHVGSALMSNDDQMASAVLSAAASAGEPMWRLPLWPEFDKEMKSDVADLKNISGPSTGAGTITASAFLQNFVGTTPWTHLDIAGTAWDCKATGQPSKGGSGFGLRTVVNTCLYWKK